MSSGNLRKKEVCWKDVGRLLELKGNCRSRFGNEQKTDISGNPGSKALPGSASAMSQGQLQLHSKS